MSCCRAPWALALCIVAAPPAVMAASPLSVGTLVSSEVRASFAESASTDAAGFVGTQVLAREPVPGTTSQSAGAVSATALQARSSSAQITTTSRSFSAATAAETPVDEVVVTGTFRERNALDVPSSVTVLDADTLRATTLQHFVEATALVPNLNWSGEGARARYFQLRGIGELEQYEGAPNPSVGFLIDDIDFSSLGSAATLFDIDRIEVMRGPQGTRYGANALGGLIYMRSTEPSRELTGDVELTGGSDGTASLGAAVGGPLTSNSAYRVSVQKYQGDGFRRNTYLHRDDTYGRDELTTRAKLRWEVGDRIEVETTGMYVDIDDGYDAWTIDNDFMTETNRPGRDAQRSVAGSVRVTARLDRFTVVGITSANHTTAVNSFDADWGNPDLWAPYIYDYFTDNHRRRRTYSQEVRLLSEPDSLFNGRGDWLVGVYTLHLTEANDLANTGVYGDSRVPNPMQHVDVLNDLAHSRYHAANLAVFGELNVRLGARAELTAGLRTERRRARYTDTRGNRFAPVDHMLGGELAVTWRMADNWRTYLRLARGYKAGGFNTAFAGVDFSQVNSLTADQIQFGPEGLWSLEGGVKGDWLDGRLSGDIGVFVGRRIDQQIKIPLQLRLGDPSSFLFLTENAERARLHGLETSVNWQVAPHWTLSGSLGLLSTEITQFALYPALQGRGEAHAPNWNYAFGVTWRDGGWWTRLGVTGRDAFYFDYSHDQKSRRYSLVNLHAGRDFGHWSAELWATNLFDREYAVRGFYFGDEPPDFPNKLYVRLGDPRHVGLTLRYHF